MAFPVPGSSGFWLVLPKNSSPIWNRREDGEVDSPLTILDWTEQAFIHFLLVTMRITGLLTAAPVFQSRNLPSLVWLGIVLFISLVIAPVIPGTAGVSGPLPVLGLLALQEILVGLVMGFMVNMALAAVQVAGQLIDVPMGFGMVNVLDPSLE